MIAAVAVAVAPADASDQIDTSFGGGDGIVTVPLNGGYDASAIGDAFPLGDDRFMVAGWEGGYGLALSVHEADGSLDTSFDSDGITTFSMNGLDGINASGAIVGGLVVDSVGSAYVLINSGTSAVVVKVTPGGALDGSFGGGDGAVNITNVGSTNGAGGIRLSADGLRLLVAYGIDDELRIAAFAPGTGAVDGSFGASGERSFAFPAGDTVQAADLAVRPLDGAITVTGQVFTLGVPRTVVARVTSTGDVASFGTGGVATPWAGTSGPESFGSEVLVAADGTAYVGGSADDHRSLALTRLTSSGGLDPAFDGDGRVTDFAADASGPRGFDGLNLQGDGSVVAAGGRFTAGGPILSIRRFSATGAADASLDADVPGYAPAYAMVTQPGAQRYVAVSFDLASPATSNKLVLMAFKGAPGPGPTPTPTPTPTPGPSPAATPAPAPGGPSDPSGGGGPPDGFVPVVRPYGGSGCTASVQIGPLKASGGCLKRVGVTWESTGIVDIAGMVFEPGAGGKVIFDPLNLRIAGRGTVAVKVKAQLQGRTFGPVTIGSGTFDLVFQYRRSLAGLRGLTQPLPGEGSSVVSGAIEKLPGLSGVYNETPLPDLNFPDFSKVSAANVDKLAGRISSLKSVNVSIPLSSVGLSSLPRIVLRLPANAGSLLGFPVIGDMTFKPAERDGAAGADVTAYLKLPPALGGVGLRAAVFVGADGGVRVTQASAFAEQIWAGVVRIAPLSISYDGATNLWQGGADVHLPFDRPISAIGGNVAIRNGVLEFVALRVAGEVPLGPSVTLNRLEGALTTNPLRIVAGAGLSAGGGLVAINGGFDFNGDRAILDGDLAVAGNRVAGASAEYWRNGFFKLTGTVEQYIDAGRQYGFEAFVDARAWQGSFTAEGAATFRAKNLRLEGRGILSNVGVAACAKVAGTFWGDVSLGAGYLWGAPSIQWIGGACDFSPYRTLATAAQAGGVRTLQVKAGEKAVSYRFTGQGGPPRFTLTGPKGEKLVIPADGSSVQNDRFMAIQQPADATTFVAIAAPSAGAWTVTPEAGAPAIVGSSGSELLPKPEVKATLRKGVLRYTVKPIPGQKVTFVQRGANVERPLGTAKGATGTLKVPTYPGKAGTRRIVALVTQGGTQRAVITVASFTAKDARLARPGALRLRRRGADVQVTWAPVVGAQGYRVRADFNGRTSWPMVKGTGRSVVLEDVLPTAPAKVTVEALGTLPRFGRPASATLAPVKARSRTGKVPKGRKPSRR